jgi:hypothetical protein
VNREFVDSIKLRGQQVPALGWLQPRLRDGKPVVLIVQGRRRWKAIQMVWAEMLAAGVREDHLPPFHLIVRRFINDLDAFESWVIENSHRDHPRQILGRADESVG